ncbi:MAG: hydantoinase B/oxoprolinase family protein [Planctomycetota bacterium]|nr:hydantoinase B/oxoprolinase family protein [Planctomycetota bacterium]
MSEKLRVLVFHHLFAAVCEEMGEALLRSAFSANIKERRDFSCALFDAAGSMVAQAAHLPVHLGSTPLSVRAAMELGPFTPGDTVVLNDPFAGGTHLPDITLVTPVFLEGRQTPDFYVAGRAHHADVGGTHPGSMGPSNDIHGEGLRIPPLFLMKGGEVNHTLLQIVRANMRVPDEREADLLAQLSANRVGAKRLGELAERHGRKELLRQAGGLLEWTASLLESALSKLAGKAGHLKLKFKDELELPGGEGIPLAVVIRIDRLDGQDGKHHVTFDLTEIDKAIPGPANAPRAVTLSAVFYVLRLLLPPGTPTNDGILSQVDVRTTPGSFVDASYPSAVSAGNVETSQRLVDLLLGAFSNAPRLRDVIPAASAGTMSNLTFGAVGGKGTRAFAHYETIAGGAGASAQGGGEHAVQTHMTNTRNTPIESLEVHDPVRIVSYTVRRGSGGKGAFSGGDGLLRRLRFLVPARLSWVAQRGHRGPWGLAGGGAGKTGGARLYRGGRGRAVHLGIQASIEVAALDEVELQTPGGGGYGL